MLHMMYLHAKSPFRGSAVWTLWCMTRQTSSDSCRHVGGVSNCAHQDINHSSADRRHAGSQAARKPRQRRVRCGCGAGVHELTHRLGLQRMPSQCWMRCNGHAHLLVAACRPPVNNAMPTTPYGITRVPHGPAVAEDTEQKPPDPQRVQWDTPELGLGGHSGRRAG